jgi:hypothetical protein
MINDMDKMEFPAEGFSRLGFIPFEHASDARILTNFRSCQVNFDGRCINDIWILRKDFVDMPLNGTRCIDDENIHIDSGEMWLSSIRSCPPSEDKTDLQTASKVGLDGVSNPEDWEIIETEPKRFIVREKSPKMLALEEHAFLSLHTKPAPKTNKLRPRL